MKRLSHSCLIVAMAMAAGCAGLRSGRLDPQLARVLELKDAIAQHEAGAVNLTGEEHARLHLQLADAYFSWGSGNDTGRDPTETERIDIMKVIAQETEEPILSIRVCGTRRAVVQTGVIRGPLSGGGHTFCLMHSDAGWRIVQRRFWVS